MCKQSKQSKRSKRSSARARRVVSTLSVASFCMVVGACATSSSSGDVAIKSVRLGQKKVGTAAPAVAGENVPAIKIDTVGFPSSWPKVVVFNVDPAGAYLADAAGKKIRELDTSGARSYGLDAASQDQVWQLDLGDVWTPRDDLYIVRVNSALKNSYRHSI